MDDGLLTNSIGSGKWSAFFRRRRGRRVARDEQSEVRNQNHRGLLQLRNVELGHIAKFLSLPMLMSEDLFPVT